MKVLYFLIICQTIFIVSAAPQLLDLSTKSNPGNKTKEANSSKPGNTVTDVVLDTKEQVINRVQDFFKVIVNSILNFIKLLPFGQNFVSFITSVPRLGMKLFGLA